MNGQSANWMFTAFTGPDFSNSEDIAYYIYQKEKCPSTGKEHWQGYIELKKKMTMKGVKMLFGDFKIHLERRKGTQDQAIAYCSKELTRMEMPVIFGIRKKAGKRNDILEIMEDVHDGHTMKEILASHGGNALRMIHCIERAIKVEHELSMLDQYVLLKRKEKENGGLDRLDEIIVDRYEQKLFN